MKKVEAKSLGAVHTHTHTHTLHLENKKIGSKESLKNRNARLEVKNKERGITLIALVITIVVLLILAGVSILMLTGENGILTQASNAKKATEQASAKEKLQLAVMAARSQAETGALEADKLITEITDNYGGTTTNNNFPLNVTMDGIKFEITEDGEVKTKNNTIGAVPDIDISCMTEIGGGIITDVTVKNEEDVEGEIIFKYYIESNGESDDKYQLKYTGTEKEYVFEDVTNGGKYIKVEAITENGDVIEKHGWFGGEAGYSDMWQASIISGNENLKTNESFKTRRITDNRLKNYKVEIRDTINKFNQDNSEIITPKELYQEITKDTNNIIENDQGKDININEYEILSPLFEFGIIDNQMGIRYKLESPIMASYTFEVLKGYDEEQYDVEIMYIEPETGEVKFSEINILDPATGEITVELKNLGAFTILAKYNEEDIEGEE